MIEAHRDAWSGDGDFTRLLVDSIATIEQVGFLRVEDAPATGADAVSNFISNEIFVAFRIRRGLGTRRVLGALRVPAIVLRKSLTLAGLGDLLAAVEGIGAPDYADQRMLQYLRAERVAGAYQKRGPKVVEMVRIYEVWADGR